MKLMAVILMLASSAAAAQEAEGEPDGPSRGIDQLLRDLFSEVEPALRGLREQIDNLNDYEAPEILPNGDIIIRRKTPLDPAPEPEMPEGSAPDETIDL